MITPITGKKSENPVFDTAGSHVHGTFAFTTAYIVVLNVLIFIYMIVKSLIVHSVD